MADVKKSAEAIVTATTTQAQREMRAWGKAVQKTKQDIALQNATMRTAQAESASLRKSQTLLARAQKRLGAVTAKDVALGMAGATVAVIALASAARNLAKEAVSVQAVFSNLKISINSARSETLGLINDFNLAKAANAAVRFGVIETAEEFGELAGAATKLGLSVGQDATKSVSDLTLALARGSPKILDNLGILLKQSEASEIYAKRLGVQVSSLGDEQRALAFSTIGRERAIETAKALTIETDTTAFALERAAIAAENLALRAAGASTAEADLQSAFTSLNQELLDLDITSRTYGADLNKLESAMIRYGVTTEEVGGKTALLNKLLEAQAALVKKNEDAVKAAAETQRRAGIDQRVAAAKAVTDELAFEIQLAQANGLEQQSILQLKVDQAEAALAVNKAEEDTSNELLKQRRTLTQNIELSQARLETFKRTQAAGRGGGRRRDPLTEFERELGRGFVKRITDDAKEFDEAITRALDAHAQFAAEVLDVRSAFEDSSAEILNLERMIELEAARGGQTEELQRAAHDLRLLDAAFANDQELTDQLNHEERVRRITLETAARQEAAAAAMQQAKEREAAAERARKAEAKAEKDRLRDLDRVVTANTDATARILASQLQSSKGSAKAFANEISEFAQSRAVLLGIQGAFMAARAIGAAIIGSPRAALFGAAAAKLFVEAAAMGAIAASFGGGRSSFSIGGGEGTPITETTLTFGNRTNFGAGDPRAGPGGGGQSAPGAPISPLEEDLASSTPVSARDEGARIVNVHFNGAILDDEKVIRLLQDSQRRTGVLAS